MRLKQNKKLIIFIVPELFPAKSQKDDPTLKKQPKITNTLNIRHKVDKIEKKYDVAVKNKKSKST